LYVKNWSEEKNLNFFGDCSNPNSHGHNYSLVVTVTGELDTETGMLIDLKVLKDIIKEEIEDKFDHKNINLDISEFKDVNPTAENMAVVIWQLMRKRIDEKFKLKVILYETERNFVEFNGR